jgi:hypothetical protein
MMAESARKPVECGLAAREHQRQEALQRLANGESLVNVARTHGVDPTTIGRLHSPFPGRAAAL